MLIEGQTWFRHIVRSNSEKKKRKEKKGQVQINSLLDN